MSAVTLAAPSVAMLPAYVAALRSGWSPSTTRDACAEQLAEIEADAETFLRQFQRNATGFFITLADGSTRPRLSGATYWIWDGGLCGSINFRHVPGTEDLPPHVSGHVGYSVVPDKRGRGVARTALRLLLPMLREAGMRRASLTCDETNAASRRVIEAAGGVFDGLADSPDHPGVNKLRFWILVPAPPTSRDTPPDPRSPAA